MSLFASFGRIWIPGLGSETDLCYVFEGGVAIDLCHFGKSGKEGGRDLRFMLRSVEE
jgi:hypothetical protein